MTTGPKFDKNRPRVGLMMDDFSDALMEVAKVTSMNAEKNSPGSWRRAINAEDRYIDDLYRHLFARKHLIRDPETRVSHLAYTAWNALALLEIELEAAREFERSRRAAEKQNADK